MRHFFSSAPNVTISIRRHANLRGLIQTGHEVAQGAHELFGTLLVG
jgi:hypothetical protein